MKGEMTRPRSSCCFRGLAKAGSRVWGAGGLGDSEGEMTGEGRPSGRQARAARDEEVTATGPGEGMPWAAGRGSPQAWERL